MKKHYRISFADKKQKMKHFESLLMKYFQTKNESMSNLCYSGHIKLITLRNGTVIHYTGPVQRAWYDKETYTIEMLVSTENIDTIEKGLEKKFKRGVYIEKL